MNILKKNFGGNFTESLISMMNKMYKTMMMIKKRMTGKARYFRAWDGEIIEIPADEYRKPEGVSAVVATTITIAFALVFVTAYMIRG